MPELHGDHICHADVIPQQLSLPVLLHGEPVAPLRLFERVTRRVVFSHTQLDGLPARHLHLKLQSAFSH